MDPRLRRISIIISKLEVRGIEPRTFRMQSGRSTTELHPPASHLNAGNLRIDPNILNFRTRWGFSYNRPLALRGHVTNASFKQ